MGSNSSADRRLILRAGVALAASSVRYWSTVAPVVNRELRRWEHRARTIEDPQLRALALEKLKEESFNAQAGAMLATVAPRRHRSDAVEAIVALELLFDYLDGLTERPSADPMRFGRRLFTAYSDAVSLGGNDTPGAGDEIPLDDSGYLQALSTAANAALARLPGAPAVRTVAQKSADLSIQAQVRMHSASNLGTGQLGQWARAEARGTGLEWRELLAGAASSVLALHALIAAAADPLCSQEQAAAIESAYFSICVVLTLLDGIVDHDRDIGVPKGVTGMQRSYAGLFEDPNRLGDVLGLSTRRAMVRVGALRDGPHHTAVLAGVVAYYFSHPGARSAYAKPILGRIRVELGPLITPTLMLMRLWRSIKRLRNRATRATA